MSAEEGEDFAAWYRAEHRRLVAAMLLVTGDLDAARDATDEAFARAYAHWPRVCRMDSPRGWTYRVALNVVRRQWLRQPRPPEVPAPAGEIWEVVLRFVADLTEEQVGSVMGVSRRTISSSLADARRALGHMLVDPDEAVLEVRCV